jgi:hypothetical protein
MMKRKNRLLRRQVSALTTSLMVIVLIPALTCLILMVAWEWYKNYYFRSVKQGALNRVVTRFSIESSLVDVQAHVQNSVTGDWYLMGVEFTFEAEDPFTPFEGGYYDFGGGDLVCSPPQKLEDGNGETAVYRMGCGARVSCWDLVCVPVDKDIP